MTNDGDYNVFEGENFNILGTPANGDTVVSVAVDSQAVSNTEYNNIDDLAPRYYCFQNIGKSRKILFSFGGGV